MDDAPVELKYPPSSKEHVGEEDPVKLGSNSRATDHFSVKGRPACRTDTDKGENAPKGVPAEAAAAEEGERVKRRRVVPVHLQDGHGHSSMIVLSHD